MSESWAKVDTYFEQRLLGRDAALEHALAASKSAGLPEIQVSPLQGKMLMLLARSMGAKRILEIGTLGGYSAIWLARALAPGGKLVTLEFDEKHAGVAGDNLSRAGFSSQAEVIVGAANDTLAAMHANKTAPFDFIFIDADKENYPGYLAWSLKLSRPGTMIVADNVVRGGEIANPASKDARVQGTQKFIELLAAEPRVTATAIQTVGGKSYDGFALALVTG